MTHRDRIIAAMNGQPSGGRFSRFMAGALRWAFGGYGSPYEGANQSQARGRVPGATPGDARRDLSAPVRTELVRRSRYLSKNSGFVRELVGDMAIYSTGDGIRPQAQSPDPEWNRGAEAYFKSWSARCEVTGRFSFEECQSIVCRGIDIDGEYFVLKTRDAAGEPVIQLIEAHRVGEGDREGTVDGIGLDATGRPRFYRILEDDGAGIDVPAASVLHVFEPESASAVRAAPVIQHSINNVLDEMELLALEKHAVKDNCDIARVLKSPRDLTDEDTGDFQIGAAEIGSSDPVSLQKIVGGKLVALKPGEELDSFHSGRPSPTFTGFLEHLRRDSALGVLPFEFAADSTRIGGAGVRLVVAKADRRFSFRQMILIGRFLNPVWAYVIGDAIERGLLENVVGWHRVRFQCPRRLSVDAGREAQQNRADVEAGLRTLEDSYAELGQDFEEQAEIRAQNARLLLDLAVKYQVPVGMLYGPAEGVQSRPPPQAKSVDPQEENTR
ncbi:MAG: phage portal protein, partial [Verrucomicrobiae bacterium]|nr:phage portal protein [Verrucomicrobiae bacterium]